MIIEPSIFPSESVAMPLAQLIISLISPLLLMRLLAELFARWGYEKAAFRLSCVSRHAWMFLVVASDFLSLWGSVG